MKLRTFFQLMASGQLVGAGVFALSGQTPGVGLVFAGTFFAVALIFPASRAALEQGGQS